MEMCRHFNPNPWKPTVCRDCRKPQSAHFETKSLAAVPETDVLRESDRQHSFETGEEDYANMPIKGSKSKKSPSFSKKFNTFIGRDKEKEKEKAPKPVPRKKPLAVDISEPIRPGERIQSDSSFESVSSIDDELGNIDLGSFGEAFDGILNPNGETTETDKKEEETKDAILPVVKTRPSPLNGVQAGRSGINGYTEIDLMSPEETPVAEPPARTPSSSSQERKEDSGVTSPDARDGPDKPAKKPKPPLKAKPNISVKTRRRTPPPLPAPYASKFKGDSSTNEVSSPKNAPETTTATTLPTTPPTEKSTATTVPVGRTTPVPLPTELPTDVPLRRTASVSTPTEKSAPVPVKRGTSTSTPTEPSAPVPIKRTTPTPTEQSAPVPVKRTTPTPTPAEQDTPGSVDGTKASLSLERLPSASSQSEGDKPSNKPLPPPRVKSPLSPDEILASKGKHSPRQRSQTLGSHARRRPPPAPPVKKPADVHFPLSHTPTSDADGEEKPPQKPKRVKPSTAAETVKVPARPPTPPLSLTGSPVSDHESQPNPVNKEEEETVETTNTDVKEKKKKSSAFSKMKHKFGKSKTHKDSGVKESAPNDHEFEATIEADKEGKKGFKLFRKRSKTFSGHKHATGEETDSASQENSPAVVRRGHSVSPPPALSPPSPVSPRRRAATLANRPLPAVEDTKTDDSHDYAECGEKIPPKPKPSQEHSGNTMSGSLKAVSNSSIAQTSPTDRISIASDFLPSLHPETVPTDPLILSVGQLQALMAEAISDSCKKISVMYKQLFTPPSSLKVTWNDCKPRQDWPAVDIDGKAFGVQVVDNKRSQLEEEVAQQVSPHPHIVRRLAIFSDTPSFHIPGLPKLRGLHKYLLGSASSNITVREFLRNYRREVSLERYERMVSFVLLQMFLALHHLHRQFVVHCDLSPDSLIINPNNHHVQVSNFSFALCNKSKSFKYPRQDVKLLSELRGRFPPEITSKIESNRELDFSGTSVFQAGCLIYELMGQDHPFESEPELVESYTMADLPPFPPSTPYSPHLQLLTRLLLDPDQSKRITAATGLQILSCILWLPHTWTVQPVAESHVHHYLIYEKTRLVAEFGESSTKGSPKNVIELEGLLKSSFLTLVSANQILKTLETYSRDMTSLMS